MVELNMRPNQTDLTENGTKIPIIQQSCYVRVISNGLYHTGICMFATVKASFNGRKYIYKHRIIILELLQRAERAAWRTPERIS